MRLFLVVLLYIAIVILLFTISYNTKPTSTEIVISHYQENLDWVFKIPSSHYSKLTIYNKGTPKDYSKFVNIGAVIHTLPNVGREVHTYLHHIIKNYDNLSDLTVFLPGSVASFSQKKEQYNIISYLQNQNESIVMGIRDDKYIEDELKTFSIDEYEVTNAENRKENSSTKLEPAWIRPFGKWLKVHFPGEKLTCSTQKGVFSAAKGDIQKRSIDFYKDLIQEVETQNPEEVHYIERTWHLILSLPKNACVELIR